MLCCKLVLSFMDSDTTVLSPKDSTGLLKINVKGSLHHGTRRGSGFVVRAS